MKKLNVFGDCDADDAIEEFRDQVSDLCTINLGLLAEGQKADSGHFSITCVSYREINDLKSFTASRRKKWAEQWGELHEPVEFVQANYLLNACDEVDLKIEILWWKNDGDWCILEFFFEGPASEKSGPGILCAETKTYRAYYDEMLEKLKSSGLKLTDLETYFEEPTVQKNYEIEKSLSPARRACQKFCVRVIT